MAVARSKRVEISRRRALVAERYVAGATQVQIAAELNVSQPTVSGDLRALQKEWRNAAIADIDMARGIELAKLAHLEREAWMGWERSKVPAEVTRVSDGGTGGAKRAQKTVMQRVGDARFLDQIHKCVAARRSLLGLDSPTKLSQTTPDGKQAMAGTELLLAIRSYSRHHGTVGRESDNVIDDDYIQRVVNQAVAEQEADDARGDAIDAFARLPFID